MKNVYLFLLTFSVFGFSAFSQNGLNFDGINDYVQTSYTGISGTAPRTVEAWINTTANCNPSNGGSQKIITDWGSSATGARFTFNILWSNAIRLEVSGNGLSGTIPVNDGQWHHVAVVYDPSQTNYVKLYVDGVLDVEGTLTVTVNTASSVNMRIGQRVDGVNMFDGKIDEVRVWNTAKSQTEIQAGMNNELCSIPLDLKAYYRFNNGIADGTNTGLNSVQDLSGVSNPAFLVNFALSGANSNWTTGATLAGGFTTSSITESACNSYTWSANGMTYANSGTYTTTLAGANTFGCDYIAKLVLTINTDSDQTTTVAECDSYLWSVNGMTYTSSATVVEALTSSQGCPYNHTLDLTIYSSSSSSSTVANCGSYLWDANGTTYANSGVYTANLLTVNGCDSIVTLDLTITDVTSSYTDNGNGSYTADGTGANYEWLKCTSPWSTTGITSQTFTPTQNGNYALVTTVNNCSDTSACFTVSGVGLNELKDSPFRVYPNPTSEVLNIESNAISYRYALTDISGKKIIESSNSSTGNKSIQLDLPSGYYFLKLQVDGTEYIHPIIKK